MFLLGKKNMANLKAYVAHVCVEHGEHVLAEKREEMIKWASGIQPVLREMIREEFSQQFKEALSIIRPMIQKMIHMEFKEALYREITIEKAARKSGDVDGEIEKSVENVLDMLVRWLPYTEGAVRGSQEDSNKAYDMSLKTLRESRQVAELLGAMQNPVLAITRFTGLLAQSGIMERLEEIATIDLEGPELKEIGAGGENEGDNR